MTLSRALAQAILSYQQDGLSADAAAEKVITFVTKRGLTAFLPAVARELVSLQKLNKQAHTLRFYTPYPLSTETKQMITKKMQHAPVQATKEVIDEALIAGFRAEHHYRFFDATYAGVLKRIEKHLLQA